MNRPPVLRSLAFALVASLALVGCKRGDDDARTTTSAPATGAPDTSLPPAPTPAPMPTAGVQGSPQASVSGLELGNAVGGDNRVSSAMSTFGPRDTIYASVTTGANATGSLDARWTFLGATGAATAPVQVHTESKQLAGGGPTTHEFHVGKPDGWPVGRYRLEISQGGRVVQSREFEVR